MPRRRRHGAERRSSTRRFSRHRPRASRRSRAEASPSAADETIRFRGDSMRGAAMRRPRIGFSLIVLALGGIASVSWARQAQVLKTYDGVDMMLIPPGEF